MITSEPCSCGQQYATEGSRWCFWCSAFGPDVPEDVPVWREWMAELDRKAQANTLAVLSDAAIDTQERLRQATRAQADINMLEALFGGAM